MTRMGDAGRPATRAVVPALLIVLAAALALRLTGLGYSLWVDEIASTQFARVPVGLLWSDWMMRETNPPLYYTLLHGWTALAGGSDVALRLLSVAIGLVAVALVFALGARAGGGWTGVVAAALVALSAQNVLYSQQVRAYILADAAAVAAILAALAVLGRAGDADPARRRRALAGYVAAAMVACYAHTTMILLPALTGAFVLARLLLRRPRAGLAAAEWIGANAALLLLWSWWARITVLQATSRATIAWIGTPSIPYAARMTMQSYLPWDIGAAQYAVAVLAVAAAIGGAWRWRARPDLLLLPYLALGLPVLLYLLSLAAPMFLDRTVYWGSAPFLVTVAAGLVAIRPRPLAGAAIAAALAATLAGWAAWFPTREIEPWRGVADAIARQRPGATVLVGGKGPTLALRRYCPPPACPLTIVGIAAPAIDSWASGIAVPGMAAEGAGPALLRRRGALVAVRWALFDPLPAPQPEAQWWPLDAPTGPGNTIAVRTWQRWR